MADFWSSPPAATEIRILSRETVLPSSPTSRHAFFLSCLDFLWQNAPPTRRVLFYEPLAPSPVDNVAHPPLQLQQLKRSLALCLVHYFPWCGRVTKGVDPPHRLFIDCNDAGVDFVEASINVPLSLLAQDGFQMKPFFEQLCQKLDHSTGDSLLSSPLLAVQATFFSDGGLALGITTSHIVVDGQSLWNFMISWAECSRGVSLSLPPLHDRHRLALPDPSPEKGSQWSFVLPMREEDKVEEEMQVSAMSQVEEKESVAETTPSTNGRRTESAIDVEPAAAAAADPLVQCVLDLPFSAIKKLKSEVGEGRFSSYEVICAHFWQRCNAARQAANHSLTYIVVLANCRSRMTPPLPPSYFGNVVSCHMAFSTAGKIGNEALCTTAGRIHELVVEAQEDVESLMHFLETNDNRFSIRSLLRGKGYFMGSSPRFPVYQVDFGWGKPVAVRPGKMKGEGEILLTGGRGGSVRGDIEICIALPASVLKRLLADPLFLPKLPSSRVTQTNSRPTTDDGSAPQQTMALPSALCS